MFRIALESGFNFSGNKLTTKPSTKNNIESMRGSCIRLVDVLSVASKFASNVFYVHALCLIRI